LLKKKSKKIIFKSVFATLSATSTSLHQTITIRKLLDKSSKYKVHLQHWSTKHCKKFQKVLKYNLTISHVLTYFNSYHLTQFVVNKASCLETIWSFIIVKVLLNLTKHSPYKKQIVF